MCSGLLSCLELKITSPKLRLFHFVLFAWTLGDAVLAQDMKSTAQSHDASIIKVAWVYPVAAKVAGMHPTSTLSRFPKLMQSVPPGLAKGERVDGMYRKLN